MTGLFHILACDTKYHQKCKDSYDFCPYPSLRVNGRVSSLAHPDRVQSKYGLLVPSFGTAYGLTQWGKIRDKSVCPGSDETEYSSFHGFCRGSSHQRSTSVNGANLCRTSTSCSSKRTTCLRRREMIAAKRACSRGSYIGLSPCYHPEEKIGERSTNDHQKRKPYTGPSHPRYK